MAKKITRSVVVSQDYPWGSAIKEQDYHRNIRAIMRMAGEKVRVRPFNLKEMESRRQAYQSAFMSYANEVPGYVAEIEALREENKKYQLDLDSLREENRHLRREVWDTQSREIENRPKRRFGLFRRS